MVKKKHVINGIVIILVILVIYSLFFRTASAGQYDEFAQCLTDSGTKMFGAYWCPHCNAQKATFGNSWDKVNYIECSLPGGSGQTAECTREGIQGYPTWEFQDGSRRSGELSLQTLSDLSGCALPE